MIRRPPRSPLCPYSTLFRSPIAGYPRSVTVLCDNPQRRGSPVVSNYFYRRVTRDISLLYHRGRLPEESHQTILTAALTGVYHCDYPYCRLPEVGHRSLRQPSASKKSGRKSRLLSTWYPVYIFAISSW